jgi:styrene-oxide isomerase
MTTTQRHQALMIGNGALVVLVGLVSGFALLFNLLGEITLWPVPGSLDVQIPGDPRRWVAAHIGNIMNALLLFAVALALPHLRFKPASEKFVAWGLIVVVWGNAGFYILTALGATGRGLSFGPNRFGGGDLMSQAAFLVGYPGALVAVIAMLLIAVRAFATARESGS